MHIQTVIVIYDHIDVVSNHAHSRTIQCSIILLKSHWITRNYWITISISKAKCNTLVNLYLYQTSTWSWSSGLRSVQP